MVVGCGGSPTGGGGVVFSLSEVSAEINIIRWKLAEAWKMGGGGATPLTSTAVNHGGEGRDASCLVSTRVCS